MRLAGQLHPATDPQFGADPLDTAMRIAIDCCGSGNDSFDWFVDQYIHTDALVHLSPVTLACAAAELFLRGERDMATVLLSLAHERDHAPEHQRSPRQLLEAMIECGFRCVPSEAMRRAEAAYLRELGDDLDVPTATPGSMLLN